MQNITCMLFHLNESFNDYFCSEWSLNQTLISKVFSEDFPVSEGGELEI